MAGDACASMTGSFRMNSLQQEIERHVIDVHRPETGGNARDHHEEGPGDDHAAAADVALRLDEGQGRERHDVELRGDVDRTAHGLVQDLEQDDQADPEHHARRRYPRR